MCDMASHTEPLVSHVDHELAAEVRRRAELDGRSASGWIRQQLSKATGGPMTTTPHPPRNPMSDPRPREPLGPDARPAPVPHSPQPANPQPQPGREQ